METEFSHNQSGGISSKQTEIGQNGGGKSRQWQPQKLNKIPGLTAIGGVAKEYTTKCSNRGGGIRIIAPMGGARTKH